MKAVPHPDKGGEPAPLLCLPPARDRAAPHILRRLYDLLIYVEKELASGPWSVWDQQVLESWREIVKTKIGEAEEDLHFQLHPIASPFPTPDYEIIEPS